MKFRGLMAGAIVLLALGAGLYYSNKQKSAEAAKPVTSPDTRHDDDQRDEQDA